MFTSKAKQRKKQQKKKKIEMRAIKLKINSLPKFKYKKSILNFYMKKELSEIIRSSQNLKEMN